jgi:hypothetical protein
VKRRAPTPAFPQLRRVFAGYLHEDFGVEHGTAEAALRAFRADASSRELQRFRTEAKRFLDHISALDFAEVRQLVLRLGSRWAPPSREALTALLRDAAE